MAERARDGQLGRSGRQGFFHAVDPDLLAGPFFHPEAGASCATAEGVGPVPRHLDHVDTAERADNAARGSVDVVVAAEKAGVVVGDPLGEAGTREVEAPSDDQLFQQLGVVDDLVMASVLGVLVGHRVEAMGALGDDLGHPEPVESFDVLAGEHLEQVLVARAARRISGAQLGGTENREVDPSSAQQCGHGPGDALVAVVEGSGATDPEEVLVGEWLRVVHHRDALGQRPGPLAPVALGEPVGIGLVLHGPVGATQLGGEVGFHEGEVAAHVEDLVEDLDADRAGHVAGPTRGAGPEFLWSDAFGHEVGLHGDLGNGADRGRRRWCAGRSHYFADLEDDLSGIEGLAGGVRGAHHRAASTDGAGVGVDQLLPGEVLDGADAEARQVGLREVRHGRHGSSWSLTVRQVQIQRRGEHVSQLRSGQEHQECHERRDVDAPQPTMQGLQRAV